MTEPVTVPLMESALTARGLSVARLCRRADLAQSTWHRWKTGATGQPRGKLWQRAVEEFQAMVREHDALTRVHAHEGGAGVAA